MQEPRGEEEARTGYRHVGGEVSDVEPTGLADPTGFVKDKELSGVGVLLLGRGGHPEDEVWGVETGEAGS